MDSSPLCVSDNQLSLSGSSFEAFVYTILFPPICLFGLLGNALTITVLISNDVMSRANILLACVAVCDMCFLVLIIPHSIANFDAFSLNYHFRYLYLPSKMHLIAFANWSSAVAIWLVVGVCFERVVGVRSPLHRLALPSRAKLCFGLFLLAVACLILTFYNHVSHHCVVKSLCNNTQIMSICLDVNDNIWPGNRTNVTPLFLREYVKISRVVNAVLVVIIPLILLVTLNAMLLYYVKKRSIFLYAALGKVGQRIARNQHPSLPAMGHLFRRHSDQILQQKTEYRVAVTVCAVVTSFTITQAPSAIVLCINSLWSETYRSSKEWYDFTTLTSFLVIFGKSINFVVFCLSSSNFRSRILATLKSKKLWNSTSYVRKQTRESIVLEEVNESSKYNCCSRSHSMLTQYTRCDSRDSRSIPSKKNSQNI